MSNPEPPAPGANRRPWLLVAAFTSLAAAAWAGVLVAGRAGLPRHDVVPWALLVLATWGASLLDVRLRFRQQTLVLGADTVVLVVGLALDRPEVVLASVVFAQVASGTWRRSPPVKVAFNVANAAAAVGAAGLAFAALPGHDAGAGRWLALAVACLLVDALSGAGGLTAVRVTRGRVGRAQVLDSAASLGLSVSANATFAVVTVSAMSVSRWGGLVPMLLVVGAVLLLRRQRDLETKFANLELLYRFSHAIAGVTEATDVLTTTLRSMEELLACEHAELLLAEPGSYVRLGLHPTGALVNHTVEPDAIERRVLDSGATVSVTARSDGPLASALDRRGWHDAVAVSFQGADGLAGVMTAGQKLGFGSTFGPADARLLETFASHSSVALRGSDLLDRLRSEVAARSYDALHDALTGLGNRSLLRQHLRAVLEKAGGKPVAVLMVDLDNFREINDTLGHHAGDDVLRAAAERIGAASGTAGTTYRLGGDEFAVVLDSPCPEERAVEVAAAVRDLVGQPLLAETMNLELQVAIGVSVSPEDNADGEGLLRRADIAMYAAKKAKSGVECYDPGRDPNTTRRLRLTSDLRRAIAGGGLDLWYQPKAELPSGRVVGVEALARWRHPRYGQVPPDEFIALAEQSGTISALTWVVLDTALAQKRAWDTDGLEVDMSVNISARSLLDANLLIRLKALLDRHHVSPDGLVVELTESSMLADTERAEVVLAQIQALGVRISVDDFGTGYSSLSRLSLLSSSEVKIDKSFVTSMLSSKTEAIVAATVELAHNLGQVVTAEGVEDRATWDRLAELGCDCVQGYYLSRPMPASVATAWLVEAARRQHEREPANR